MKTTLRRTLLGMAAAALGGLAHARRSPAEPATPPGGGREGSETGASALSDPVFRITASPTRTREGGTPLKHGINVVNAAGIADTVTLPDAVGSGRTVHVHVDSNYFVVAYPQAGGQINRFGVDIAYAIFPWQRLTFRDVGDGKWDFTTNLPLLYPIYQEITAAAGGGQAKSIYLGMGTNVIRKSAAAGDSVRLPIAVGGCNLIALYNDTPNCIDVFPDMGQRINRLANNEKYALPTGKMAIFNDIGPGPDQWIGGVLDPGYALHVQGMFWFNPVAVTTYYFGNGSPVPTTTEQIQRIRIPRGGRIRSVQLGFVNERPGSAESSQVLLRKNAMGDTPIGSVDNSLGHHEIFNASLDIPVSQGDFFEFKWVTPAWAASPAWVTIGGTVYVD